MKTDKAQAVQASLTLGAMVLRVLENGRLGRHAASSLGGGHSSVLNAATHRRSGSAAHSLSDREREPSSLDRGQPSVSQPETDRLTETQRRLNDLAETIDGLAIECRVLARTLREDDGLASQESPEGMGIRHPAGLLEEAALAAGAMASAVRGAQDVLDAIQSPPSLNGSSSDQAFPQLSFSSSTEATVYPEFSPEAARPLLPVLPLGIQDGMHAAVVARQIEASRRHLQMALAVGHEVNDRAWQQELIGLLEQVLHTVTELSSLTKATLAPSAAEITFPAEARFLCAPPWERTQVSSSERDNFPATADQTCCLLRALGYSVHTGHAEDGGVRIEVTGDRYNAEVLLQQLRLSGTGDWTGHLEWIDERNQRHSTAEGLGPASLPDDELARRIDSLVRRHVGNKNYRHGNSAR